MLIPMALPDCWHVDLPPSQERKTLTLNGIAHQEGPTLPTQCLQELDDLTPVEELTGLDLKKHRPPVLQTLAVGHATVSEAIVLSLLDDPDINKSEMKKNVESCFNNIQKTEKRLGVSIQASMNKAVIAQASHLITC